MSADDLDVAKRFLAALASAAMTGEREAVYPLLGPDVEWVTPMRVLAGLDQVREQLTWVSPPEHLEVEFEERPLVDLGDGRIVADVHETYRMTGTGEFAYGRDRRIDLTVRDRLIVRYEMHVTG
jgi:hypothetical protein